MINGPERPPTFAQPSRPRPLGSGWDEVKRWPLWAKAVLPAFVVGVAGLAFFATPTKITSGGDIGHKVSSVDDLEYTVHKVEISGQGDVDEITVDMDVSNGGSDDTDFNPDDVKFIAGNGKQYDPIDAGWSQDLQPDLPIEETVRYEVPKTANPKRGFVRIHVFMGDDSDIDVGLGHPPGR